MSRLRTLFKDIQAPPYRRSLEGDIARTIVEMKSRQERLRTVVLLSGLSVSALGMVVALFVYGEAFITAEFWSIVALLFSDLSYVFDFFGEFVVLLLETVPVVPVIMLLFPVFASLVFVSFYFQTEHKRHFSY